MTNRLVSGGRSAFGIAFAIARILLGLFGCLMVLESVISFVPVAIGAPLSVTVTLVVYGFIGFMLAFGAFHHFPWERDPRTNDSATVS